MKKEKIIEVLNKYRSALEKFNISPKQYPHDLASPSKEDAIAHVLLMMNTMEEFLKADRIEKAFRWLGFIQGCLWQIDIYSIEDMKNDNRPT